MRLPKRYGDYKIEECVFCSQRALSKNKQGLNVCSQHKDEVLPEIKCVCGSYLEIKTGKWGPFFVCPDCGAMNLKRGLEMMDMQKKEKPPVHKARSDEKSLLDAGRYKDFDYGIE